jgi:Icc-related predicted phosphoesterase
MAEQQTVRVAAVGDLHCTKKGQGLYQAMFAEISERADVLVLCGDLTDYGLPEEAHVLAREIRAGLNIPVAGVLGNHDVESGQRDEVVQILTEAGVTILDGDTCEMRGIGFAGAKGFAGGFGRGALGPWGEKAIKDFVQEALDEAMRLESALARLRTEQRIAVLHYAPVEGTVEGEPHVIYPFLGCSRLEEPLLRYPVTVVFHGHAHSGSPEARTMNGIPVYNVALPLMRRRFPEQPFRVVELPVTAAEEAVAAHVVQVPG